MFEFLTGRSLFALMMLGHDQEEQDETDDDHLLQLNDILRPLLESMIKLWPRFSKWYTPDRKRLQPYGDEEPYIFDTIEVLFAKNKSPEIDEDEAAIVVPLMRRILEYDPAQRPTAEELLKHPWFSSNESTT